MKRHAMILLALCVLAVSMYGCTQDEEAKSIEYYQSKVLCGPTVASLDPDYRFDNNKSYAHITQNLDPIKTKTYQYRGTTYTDLTLEQIFREYSCLFDGVVCKIIGYGPDGKKYQIEFAEGSEELLSITCQDVQYAEADFRCSLETAKENATDYIENILIKEYEKDIDFSEYELHNVENDVSADDWMFVWCKQINDVTVHRIIIKTNPSGEVYYAEAMPVPSEEITDKIPELTKGDYYNMARSLVEKGYASVGRDIELSNFIMAGNINYAFPTLCYLDGYDTYAVEFIISWDASYSEAEKDSSMGLSNTFALPLE